MVHPALVYRRHWPGGYTICLGRPALAGERCAAQVQGVGGASFSATLRPCVNVSSFAPIRNSRCDPQRLWKRIDTLCTRLRRGSTQRICASSVRFSACRPRRKRPRSDRRSPAKCNAAGSGRLAGGTGRHAWRAGRPTDAGRSCAEVPSRGVGAGTARVNETRAMDYVGHRREAVRLASSSVDGMGKDGFLADRRA